MGSTGYVVITPVRNEEGNIGKTLASMTRQTVPPSRWIIVDDGSTDGTSGIVEEYRARFPWIQLLRLPDRGYYDLMTGGEIRAFYRGYETLGDIGFDFLMKLDGDISFDENYVESLLREFETNPRLGIASGTCYSEGPGGFVPERGYPLHPRGAGRIYRASCWKAMGGSLATLAWDAVDVYKARMLGWDTRCFPGIRMDHHVKTWVKGGILHGRERQGRINFLMGTHPLFFLGKASKVLFERPFLVGFLAMLYGFYKPMLGGTRRVVDGDLLRYIRSEQMGRMRRWPGRG